VVIANSSLLTACIAVTHFAINPTVGGIPASVAIEIIMFQLLTVFDTSFDNLFCLIFIIGVIAIMMDVQYRITYMAKHFVLTMEAIIIHLKLKTDDSPNISIADLDLICDVLPKIAEMITVTMIRGFSMKITK